MITRRRMLVASGGLAAIAAARAAAQAPTVARYVRNGTMQITRSGSQPSRKGPVEYFTALFVLTRFSRRRTRPV